MSICKRCGKSKSLASGGVCWDCVDRADSRPDFVKEMNWTVNQIKKVGRKLPKKAR